MKMAAIILAGGKATRMKGQDKAFLRINNQFLIIRQLRLLKRDFKKIIIVTNSPLKYKSLEGIRVITDFIAHQGPLGGIYSGLRASGSFYNFVVACDMPYIDTGLIKYMYKKSSGYDAVIPRIDKRYEPLYSFYSKNCLKFIGPLLERKIFRINEVFSKIKVKEITKYEVEQFSLGTKIFTNLNTRADLANVYAERPI